MTPGLKIIFIIGLAALKACDPAPKPTMLNREAAVIQQEVLDGSLHPSTFGIEIEDASLNALGSLQYAVNGGFTFCSGTLIGDRLVLTAAHCVLGNSDDWLEGALAEPLSDSRTQMTRFVIGSDVNDPICVLPIASVHTHPDSVVRDRQNTPDNANPHDLAILVLSQSAMENCPGVWPMPIRIEPLSDVFLGDDLLQGGFGGTSQDEEGASTIRMYSHFTLLDFNETEVVTNWIGDGYVYYGDSGSAILHRDARAGWQVIGVVSNFLRHARVDSDSQFIQSFYNDEQLCGALTEQSICSEKAVLSCDTTLGFDVTHCDQEGFVCVEDTNAASCTCLCDVDQYCTADCVCDADCPCTCDSDDLCTAECSCDADCLDNQASPMGCQQVPVQNLWPMLWLVLAAWLLRRSN